MMVDFLILERIFYLVGSLVALTLGIIKLNEILRPTKIKIRPVISFDRIKKEENLLSLTFEYDCSIINTGREVIGELILNVFPQHSIHLSSIIKLIRNTPKTIRGKNKIYIPKEYNKKIKEEKVIWGVVFFKDIKGKKYGIHKVAVGDGTIGFEQTKETL